MTAPSTALSKKPQGATSTPGLHQNQLTNDAIMTTPALRLSPRQSRVLDALTTTSGWIAREALDRIAGASNSPDVVLRLRRKLGDDAIDMQQVDAIDRDGKRCKPGQYRLTEQGRQRLARMEVTPC